MQQAPRQNPARGRGIARREEAGMQATRTERSRPKGSRAALRWAAGARGWRARTLWLRLALVCMGGTAAAKVEGDVEARVGARDSAPSLPFRPGEELGC